MTVLPVLAVLFCAGVLSAWPHPPWHWGRAPCWPPHAPACCANMRLQHLPVVCPRHFFSMLTRNRLIDTCPDRLSAPHMLLHLVLILPHSDAATPASGHSRLLPLTDCCFSTGSASHFAVAPSFSHPPSYLLPHAPPRPLPDRQTLGKNPPAAAAAYPSPKCPAP